jgi:branched-subunit amino acid ABC-type transport system permease component
MPKKHLRRRHRPSPSCWSPIAGALSRHARQRCRSLGSARCCCLIYAFEAVIIGGLGSSLWGTLAGGIIIGVAQHRRRRHQSRLAASSFGHVAFLVVLARPAAAALFPRAVD